MLMHLVAFQNSASYLLLKHNPVHKLNLLQDIIYKKC